VDEVKNAPQGGWRQGRPQPGGNGGNPPDPDEPHGGGGDGMGAQEDDGGGDGDFVHIICIENDSFTDCMLVKEVKLLASMTTYGDIENDIDWSVIDPIKNRFGEPPVLIPPREKWCFPLQTTGSYIGGHIYINYRSETVPCPPGARPSLRSGTAVPLQNGGGGDDDDLISIGDHPVVAHATDEDNDGLYEPWEYFYDLDDLDDGSGDPVNGPTGDKDGDSIPNIVEQDLLTDPCDPNDPPAVPAGFTTFQVQNAGISFGGAPIQADFFGPGSLPFEGNVPLQGGNIADLPCEHPGDGPVSMIFQRPIGVPLLEIPGEVPGPCDLMQLSLQSIDPITVEFEGGESQQFDTAIQLQNASPGELSINRQHYAGGFAQFANPLDLEIVFTPVGGGEPLVYPLNIPDFFGFAPWDFAAPGFQCPECFQGWMPGSAGGDLFPVEFSGGPLFVGGLAACEPVPPTPDTIGPGQVFVECPDGSWQFGDGFPPIPEGLLGAGSPEWEGSVPLVGAPLAPEGYCGGEGAGPANIVLQIAGPVNVPNIGDVTEVPIIIQDLALESPEPVQIADSFFDVIVELSPSGLSSGLMTVERTSADGGLASIEFMLFATVNFQNTDSPSDPPIELNMQSLMTFGSIPWTQGMGGVPEACNAVPLVLGGTPAPNGLSRPDAGPIALAGVVEPFSTNSGPAQLTWQTADVTPDTDGDGLTDFEESIIGTAVDNADSDGDGLPDGWEQQNGLSPLDDGSVNPDYGAGGDPDGDGATNEQELNAGTDPQDDGSAPQVAVPVAAWALTLLALAAVGAASVAARRRLA
jgi:hypothetical protein